MLFHNHNTVVQDYARVCDLLAVRVFRTMAANRARRYLIQGDKGKWEVCIGLEIHAQILAQTKLFSSAWSQKKNRGLRTQGGGRPNSHVALVDAAFPGMLPVLNAECVDQAIRTGAALNCKIQERSIFERKHYFYCDLPQGYQITQQRAPIAIDGGFKIDEDTFIRINRIQLEQDSGKSVHDLKPLSTLVDLNLAGAGLMEIVLEPDLRSPLEADLVVRHLQHLLRHIGVCDGQMEEGSMRCDLNVSVRPVTDPEAPFGDRVEVKNMNSIRGIREAADYEAKRQVKEIESGNEIFRETRTFDAISGSTRRMRKKEGAKDYRFFPEPDLLPLVLSREQITSAVRSIPELPHDQAKRLMKDYGLGCYEANVLVQEHGAVKYFEEVAAHPRRSNKLVCNWLINDIFGLLKATSTTILSCPITSERLGSLIDLISNKTISGKIAKDLLQVMFYEDSRMPLEIVTERSWSQVTDPKEVQLLCKIVVEDPVSASRIGFIIRNVD